MNKSVAIFITTFGGIGRYPGGGSIVSFFMFPFFFFSLMGNVILLGFLLALAYLATPTVCAYYKKDDPREIVIDEAIGVLFLIACLRYYSLDISLYNALCALMLFRFFDISKIAGIRYFEMLPGTTGIVADDLIAALYAYFIMYLFFV